MTCRKKKMKQLVMSPNLWESVYFNMLSKCLLRCDESHNYNINGTHFL